MNLEGTKTQKNLETAFAGESQARNKYTYYASKAKKDGYNQIAALFEETANNEKEHAKIWFKLLGGIGTTAENLKAAADGENYEWTEMYAQFAKEAKTANVSTLWKKIIDGATVKAYPAGEVKRVADGLFNYSAAQLGSQYGWAMSDYAKLLGYKNAKEFKEAEFVPSAEIIVKEKLVFNAIIAAEGIALTDEDKAEGLKEYYVELGISSTYKTYEEFEAAIDNGEILVDSIYDSILWDKVMDTLLANVAK